MQNMNNNASQTREQKSLRAIERLMSDVKCLLKDNIAGSEPVDLTPILDSLEAINNSILDQPQLEGLYLNPVCYDDAGTIRKGFVAVTLDEETLTTTTKYFDYLYLEVASLSIVDCPSSTIQLGPPIEVCT